MQTDVVSHPNEIIVVKNLDSIYLNANEFTANMLGWKSVDDCIGKTDHDIPSQASLSANSFVEQDKKAISTNKSLITLDIQHYSLGWKTIVWSRAQFYFDQQLIGLSIRGIEITQTVLAHYYHGLFQSDKKFLNSTNKGQTYILNSDHCPLVLTKKQECCLFFLIRGRSIKEIAEIMKLSPRTVEDHIDRIKNKLHCQNKKEVIEKAIDSGFLSYFPQILQ